MRRTGYHGSPQGLSMKPLYQLTRSDGRSIGLPSPDWQALYRERDLLNNPARGEWPRLRYGVRAIPVCSDIETGWNQFGSGMAMVVDAAVPAFRRLAAA